jgi:hypothetical protein
MVECYVTTVEEHLRKVISMHWRNWGETLPSLFWLDATSMVFRRELQLPCDLLFEAPLDKE